MIMVTTMGYTVPSLAITRLLDMAPNSVDDAYTTCTTEMSNRISTDIADEINTNADFKEAWKIAKIHSRNKQLTDGLTENHVTAIEAYVGEHPKIYGKFNAAVQTSKDVYKTSFKYHALHFLLTDALKKLKQNQAECSTTYRGTPDDFTIKEVNKEIRFGRFTSSSYSHDTATKFGNRSCFKIKTCHGAALGSFSHLPEDEVLIPPYEKFKVVSVEKKREKPDLWCNVVYSIISTGTLSNLDCALVGPNNH